jgi:signal transduction histidine kinase
MEFKQSLSQRIIIAFGLMSALVAGAFAAGIVLTVHLVEERLISTELGGDLQRLLAAESLDEWSHTPEPNQLFYFSGGGGQYELPHDLKHLSTGFHEVFRGPLSYHAMVQFVDGRRYVLLQDQSDFEDRERLLFAVVFVGFVFSLGIAALLGWLLARQVMAPVIRLSRQVRHRDQLLGLAPPLAPDYADDEVGQLAIAFDAALGRLRQALTRERLFTSDVSHELRTPLMVLAGSCELLLEYPMLDEASRNQVLRIRHVSEEMRELVQTFLMLARAQSNEGVSTKTSLVRVADDVTALWRVPVERKGLQLIYERIDVDETHYSSTFLHAVMGNLLRNALHHTERGSIRLEVRTRSFVVEDAGASVVESQRDLQLSQANVLPIERVGLGLSLVQRICADQGWHITLTPLAPRGCRFQVDLDPAFRT